MTQDKSSHNPLHAEIAKGSIFIFVGQFLGSLARLGTNVALTRLLGKGDYGLFSLGMTVFRLGNEFSLFGFQYGAQHFIPKYRASGRESLGKGFVWFSFCCTILLSVVVGAGLFVFARFISTSLFEKEALTGVLRGLAVVLPLHVPMMLCAFLGIAFLKAHVNVTITDIVQPAVFLALVAGLWVMHSSRGISGVVFAFGLSVLLTLFAAAALMRRMLRFGATGQPAVFSRRQWGTYSGTVVLAGFFNMFLFQTDKLILGYFGTIEEIGTYNAAWKIYSFLGMSTVVFNTMFSPVISQVCASGRLHELDSLTKLVGKWIFAVNAPLIMVIVFYPKSLMTVFGREFTSGYSVLMIFGVSWIAVSMLASTSGILRMTGKQNVEFVLSVAMLLFSIVCGIILTRRYGMIGAAVSSTLCFVIIHAAKAALSYLYFRVNPLGRGTLLSFVLAIVSVGVSYGICAAASRFITSELARAATQTGTFLAVYAVLMLKFCLSKEDMIFVEVIRRKFARNA